LAQFAHIDSSVAIQIETFQQWVQLWGKFFAGDTSVTVLVKTHDLIGIGRQARSWRTIESAGATRPSAKPARNPEPSAETGLDGAAVPGASKPRGATAWWWPESATGRALGLHRTRSLCGCQFVGGQFAVAVAIQFLQRFHRGADFFRRNDTIGVGVERLHQRMYGGVYGAGRAVDRRCAATIWFLRVTKPLVTTLGYRGRDGPRE
jgi:hypothetical protein